VRFRGGRSAKFFEIPKIEEEKMAQIDKRAKRQQLQASKASALKSFIRPRQLFLLSASLTRHSFAQACCLVDSLLICLNPFNLLAD
jgi:hypothetical protein